jgi:hypothetical protein
VCCWRYDRKSLSCGEGRYRSRAKDDRTSALCLSVPLFLSLSRSLALLFLCLYLPPSLPFSLPFSLPPSPPPSPPPMHSTHSPPPLGRGPIVQRVPLLSRILRYRRCAPLHSPHFISFVSLFHLLVSFFLSPPPPPSTPAPPTTTSITFHSSKLTPRLSFSLLRRFQPICNEMKIHRFLHSSTVPSNTHSSGGHRKKEMRR